ncbi:MAG: N-acetyltransferase [Chitinophagaceae bacterium]|nr:MAG: N-acetyltransferase [Chitinophagaceae bacterium]
MTIRPATAADAGALATCLLLAMEDIVYRLIGRRDLEAARQFLQDLVRERGNQYSYENCWVLEADHEVQAAVNVYDGAALHALRQPVKDLLRQRFGRDIHPEDETGPGEYYLDTLGVLPDQQGRGLGTQLLQFIVAEFVQRRGGTLGLLVEEDNPDAKRLYLRIGFRVQGTRMLMGKRLEHLQLRPGHPGA